MSSTLIAIYQQNFSRKKIIFKLILRYGRSLIAVAHIMTLASAKWNKMIITDAPSTARASQSCSVVLNRLTYDVLTYTTQRHTTLTMSWCLFGYLPRSREMLSVGGTHLASSNNKCSARRKNVWRREDCRSVHQQMPRVHFVSVLFMRTHNALSTSIIIITILLYRSYTMSSVVLRISYCLFL